MLSLENVDIFSYLCKYVQGYLSVVKLQRMMFRFINIYCGINRILELWLDKNGIHHFFKGEDDFLVN